MVARDQRIGGEDEVVIGDRLEILPAGWTMQDENSQAGRELARLIEPVGHQTRWSDDDRRIGQMTARLLQRKQRQDLNGLAQSHVVGQHAAQTALREQFEPGKSLRLVRSQNRVEIGWQDGSRQSAGTEQSRHTTKILHSPEDEMIGFETEQWHDLGAREPDLP